MDTLGLYAPTGTLGLLAYQSTAGLTKEAGRVRFRLFTLGARLIAQKEETVELDAGQNEMTIEWNTYLYTLAKGTYNYYLTVWDDKAEARSRMGVIIISK